MTLHRSNRLISSVNKQIELNDEINISIISTNLKVGKTMLTDLLCQTNFINRNMTFRNDEFSFVNDKSIIIRKISAKKLKNNHNDAQQWITKSDIVILVIRESLTSDDYKIASLRYSSNKKTLFIVRTCINETIINPKISDKEDEILEQTKNLIWTHFGEFLICKNNIYLIGSCYEETEKWDFSRLKNDLIQKFIIIRLEQIKESIAKANDSTISPNSLSSVHQIDEDMLNKEKEALIKYIEQNGLDRIDQYFISRLRRWEQCALNIAVTGQSGAGKSSFINAIRGVTRDSEDFAPTDYVECICTPRAYHHPIHRNLTFWDLPGCGTLAFPCETYLNTIGFENYDVIIIICSGRFTENDDWLAQQMIKIHKPFFFLRTKTDLDIENAERDCRPPFNEAEVLDRIRTNCLNQLGNKTHNQKVYLISGNQRHLHKWDMNDFIHDLREACPQLKRESLVFSMSNNCREAVKAKVQYLRERIWFLAGATAAAALLPIPGFSMSVNLLACIAEAKEYRQQLGLHPEAVERLARLKNISSDDIRDIINSILPILDEKTFEDIFKEKLLSVSAALGHCVPIMGCVFSLRAVTETLNYFLTLMEKAALIIVDIHFNDILPLTLTINSEDNTVE